MNIIQDINLAYQPYINEEKGNHYPKFFKTGPGEYGEGDLFIGVTVPHQKKIANQFTQIALQDLSALISSPYHEHRQTALFILVNKYEKAKSEVDKKNIYDYYIEHINHVNNWDLVDSSCYKIMGPYIFDKEKDILYHYAHNHNLWKKRISIITTLYFIKKDTFDDTIKIAKILLNDEHDLIHKAVGWMLREIGKRNLLIEKDFLDAYAHQMPRTMLRYAIEKFDEDLRQYYLKNLSKSSKAAN